MKEPSSPPSPASELGSGGADAVLHAEPVRSEPEAGFVSATHDVLWASEEPTTCDVCGEPSLPDDGDGYAITGRAFFLSCRGGEPHFDERPLCAGCAAALGMTALARWEIEEEEG